MAKMTKDEEFRELLKEFSDLGPAKEQDKEEFNQTLQQLQGLAPGMSKPKKMSIKQQALQVAKELPSNIDISFKNLGAAALKDLSRRGISLAGIPGELTGIDPGGRVAKEMFLPVQAQETQPKFKGLRPQTSEDVFMQQAFPQGSGAASQAVGLPAKAGFGAGERLQELAQEKAATLPEASWSASPIVQAARLTSQNGSSIGASIAASIITGNPHVGVGILAETSGSDEFFRQLEGGGSVIKSSVIAEMVGGAEAAGNALVFLKFIKGFTKGIPVREAISLILQNASQEGVTEFTQTYISEMGVRHSKGEKLDYASKQAFTEAKKALAEGFVVGGLMGTTVTGAGKSVSGIRNSIAKRRNKVTLAGERQVSQNTVEKFDKNITKLEKKNQRPEIAAKTALRNALSPEDMSGLSTQEMVDTFLEKKQEGKGNREAFLETYEQALVEKQTVDLLDNSIADQLKKEPKKPAPGSVTKPADPSTPVVSEQPITDEVMTPESNTDEAGQLIEDRHNKKAVDESQGISDQVRPVDEVAAEVSDKVQKTGQEKQLSLAQKKQVVRKDIAGLQSDLNLTDTAYREILRDVVGKNSTTTLTLDEITNVKKEMQRRTEKDYTTKELPSKLDFGQKEQKFVSDSLNKTEFSEEIWRNTLQNMNRPLSQDPFQRKKEFNDIKTSVRLQEKFARKQAAKTDIDVSAAANQRARANEKVSDFFGNWKSFRYMFSDISNQSGVDVYSMFQNIITNHAKASVDGDRAFQTVLDRHGLSSEPRMSKKQIRNVNRALFYGNQEDGAQYIDNLTPKEKKLYNAAYELFVSSPDVPNSGPLATRYRSHAWKNWHKTYTKQQPIISELKQEREQLQNQKKKLLSEAKKNEKMQESIQPIEDRRQEIEDRFDALEEVIDVGLENISEQDTDTWIDFQDRLDNATTSEEVNAINNEMLEFQDEALDKEIIDAVDEWDALVKEQNKLNVKEEEAIDKLATEVKGKEEGLKKQLKEINKRLKSNKNKTKSREKLIRKDTPVQGLGEGRYSKTKTEILKQGIDALSEGKFYSWLEKQTFATKNVYFVEDESFQQWLKASEPRTSIPELGTEAPGPQTVRRLGLLKSRIAEGSPMLSQNPFAVARNRLSKLSIADNLVYPLHDMNEQITRIWDTGMTEGQKKAYKQWIDNVSGVYDDAGVIPNALRKIQRQWWRAKGWDPQFIAKFIARNIPQNLLASGQVNSVDLTKNLAPAYASFGLQLTKKKLDSKKNNKQQISPADQQNLIDVMEQTRKSFQGDITKNPELMDPFIQEDWATFATFEVSQKVAQFNMMMHDEIGRQTKGKGLSSSLADAMPRLMAKSDTLNRWLTYLPLHQQAYTNLRQLRQGKIQRKQLWSRLALDSLEASQRKQLLGLLEEGQDRAFIREYANIKTKNIHYAYDLVERSALEQKTSNRMFSGVITWSRSAMENYVRLTKQTKNHLANGDLTAARKTTNQILKYSLTFGGLGAGGTHVIGEAWYGLLSSVNPLEWFGSPQLNFLTDTLTTTGRFVDSVMSKEGASEAQVDNFVSTMVDATAVIGGEKIPMAPVAVGLIDAGISIAMEMPHNKKQINKLEAVRVMIKDKYIGNVGSNQRYNNDWERAMKVLFDVEKQDEEKRVIPGL